MIITVENIFQIGSVFSETNPNKIYYLSIIDKLCLYPIIIISDLDYSRIILIFIIRVDPPELILGIP